MTAFDGAIEQPALALWRDDPNRPGAARHVLRRRANCNGAARRGEYSIEMEPA